MITYKEIKLENLFKKIETAKLPYKSSQFKKREDRKTTVPAITSGIDNQGRTCYVPREKATICKNCITIASNGDAGTAFYQPDEFTILQDSYAIELNDTYMDYKKENVYLYLVCAINKVTGPIFSYTNKATWNKVKEFSILLPVTESGEIDFAYMENYISELEAERISELEAYLAVTGLDDYELTEEDKEVLSL